MKKIAVASKNSVKLSATLDGFRKMFPGEDFEIEGHAVSSDVSDQPMSDSETLEGACTRVAHVSVIAPDADFYVGLEGGIEERNSGMGVFTWIVVKSKDGICGKARSATFFLPSKIAELITQGKELGEADDIVFGKSNSKQEFGAVGLLTDNVISRASYYSDTVVLALIPLKNKNLYS